MIKQFSPACFGGDDCCRPENQCREGHGDCDDDDDCLGSLVCKVAVMMMVMMMMVMMGRGMVTVIMTMTVWENLSARWR